MTIVSQPLLLGNSVAPSVLLYTEDGRADLADRFARFACRSATVLPCLDASSLFLQAERAMNGAVIVSIIGDSHRGSIGTTLQRVRYRFQHLPLMIVVPGNGVGTITPEIAQLAGATRAESIVRHDAHDMAREVTSLLALADQECAAGRILATVDAVRPQLDPRLRDFIAVAASAPRTVRTVSDVAGVVGRSVRSIERRFGAALLPPAREILGRVFTFRAAHMLQDPECTLKRVVSLLPFREPAAVCARFRRYVGVPPRGVRTAGALTAMLDEIARAIGPLSTATPSKRARGQSRPSTSHSEASPL